MILGSVLAIFWTGAAAAASLPCEGLLLTGADPAGDVSRTPLSGLVTRPRLWLAPEANSDQRQPVYLGASPFELSRGQRAEQPRLLQDLRPLGESQARAVATRLREINGATEVELEGWPVQDDDGRLTWAFARWREAGDGERAWQWLDQDQLALREPRADRPLPMLPVTKKTWLKADADSVFDDVTEQPGLYDKPLFGDAVFEDEKTGELLGAWLPLESRQAMRARIVGGGAGGGARVLARVLAQPARFNDEPVTFILRAGPGGVIFPEGIDWVAPRPIPRGKAERSEPVIPAWPRDFETAYEHDVRVLSGAEPALFPLSGRRETFRRRNSIDPRNQLGDLNDYLAERYRALGLKTVRQRFRWHGVEQSNLIAVIPGKLDGAANHPILLADHIDTAFAEDEYRRTGRRVSAPGADDNATATAALLRAAELLKDSRPDHDIWLVHLTGEEFPADDLGARHLIAALLSQRRQIGGLVLLDMVGYRKRGDRQFQISAADDDRSIAMALEAASAARAQATGYEARLRGRYDPRGYLYNTDGVIFAAMGYPVILLNEHLNRLENLDRPHYHQTTDTPEHVDFDYAAAITRVALETAARLSRQQKEIRP